MTKKYKDKNRAKAKMREKVRRSYVPPRTYHEEQRQSNSRPYNPYRDMIDNLGVYGHILSKVMGAEIKAESQRETVDMVIDKLLEAPKGEMTGEV